MSYRAIQTLYGFSKYCSRNRKKKFSFSVRGFRGEHHKWGCFWLPLPGRGPQPIEPLLWLKIVAETRPKSASVEPLNDILAYFWPKLWTKYQKLVKTSASTNPVWGGKHFLNGHNSPADRARELFKSVMNGERLVV